MVFDSAVTHPASIGVSACCQAQCHFGVTGCKDYYRINYIAILIFIIIILAVVCTLMINKYIIKKNVT
jgi:hypothetical protein